MRSGAVSTFCLAAWLLAATATASAQTPEDAVTPPPPSADVATLAASEPSAEASATTSTPAARTPKVAIVVSGDPDPSALTAVHALETVLGAEAGLTMPSDLAMRAALTGAGSSDGLDEVRAERRRLGLGESRDVTVLTVLGELASADLVLVVRAAHGVPQATAFDVLRRSYYDGELALEPVDDAAAVHFVLRRARRAARPLDPEERVAPAPAPSPVVDPATAVPPEAIAADPEPPAHEPDFFEQYWPYFAAGVLLIGAVVFIVVATQNNGTPPPVLRFEAGGGS